MRKPEWARDCWDVIFDWVMIIISVIVIATVTGVIPLVVVLLTDV